MGQANSRQRFFGLNLLTFNVVLLTAGLLVVLSLWTLGMLGTIRLAAGTMVVAVLYATPCRLTFCVDSELVARAAHTFCIGMTCSEPLIVANGIAPVA